MPTYIPTRTVRVFADTSELLYLPGEQRYVWQRPKPDGTGIEEIPIVAGNDAAALLACGQLAYVERG